MEQIAQSVTPKGVDKVTRYGWLLADDPGEFRMIPKEDLVVDPAYQREANNARVLKLVRLWCWAAFGVLIVALRDDGTYYIVDGGHRWLASMKRSDVTKLPCLVFLSRGKREEASWFLSANTERRPMRMFEKFNAMLISGDPVAKKVQALIDFSGRSVSSASSPQTISCIAAIRRIVEKDTDAAEAIWPLLNTLCKGRNFHHILVEGLHFLECGMDEGESLAAQPWRGRVISLGPDALIKGAESAAAFYAKGGPKVWARGIQNAFNHRARSHRLRVFGDD